MVQLIYASRARENLDFNDVKEILNVSHEKNKEHNITGVLLYNGTFFMQCIEGNEKEINQLWLNLLKDERHDDVQLLGTRKIAERDYKMWNMGMVNNSDAIKKVMLEESKSTEFLPHQISYDEAKAVIDRLLYMI